MIRVWIGLIAAIGLIACSPTPESPEPGSETSSTTDWREIDSPVGLFSLAPALASVDGEPILSWLERTETTEGGPHHQLLVSRWRSGGWSDPAWVASGTDLFANWADTPSVAVADDGTLFAHWLAKTAADTYAYSIFMARSDDGGETWHPLGTLNEDATPTEHGFVSYIAEWDGIRAFWLDGRQMAAGGAMNLRTARIDEQVGPTEVLDERVCECCSTAAAVTDQGPIVVFRDRSPEDIRDISIVRWTDGAWTPSATVADDNWRIDGCPVNGPEVAAEHNQVAVAWYTAGGTGPKVQIAFSADSGRSFGPAEIVDNGRPLGRVDLVLDETAGAIVSWLEGGDAQAEIRIRRFGADGVAGNPIVVARTSPSRASGFPRLARLGDDLFLAWVDLSEEGSSHVRILEIPIASLG